MGNCLKFKKIYKILLIEVNILLIIENNFIIDIKLSKFLIFKRSFAYLLIL